MAFLVKAIPLILQKVFAPLLGIVLAAWFIVLLVSTILGKRHSCRFTNAAISGKRHSCRFSSAASGRDALPRVRSDRSVASPRRWSVWVGLAVLAIVCTTLCGKNTNGVQNVGGEHLFQFNPPLVQIVSPQDVSNGWRVAEETAAESFAQPSANAVTNELWRRRGAHDDAFRIPANGWSYPYATGVTVFARGELRTNICAHDFPRAFMQDISLLPLVNWPMLPEGRQESVFWHAATPSNTLLATWLNGVLGRDATSPVSFQAELFPDGGFTYRYEDRTVRHARVWPFDWDNDGLENSVDPDPLTPGPDAHGTNAEWYNTVCSNVFSSVEGGGTGTMGILPVDDVSALPWRESVNSNAYYFVDVVTSEGPAPIYFMGDRDSRLGNPVVVANAFETNRVPLLIGIDYAITSPAPFAVSFPIDYMYPELQTNNPCEVSIHWPLEFEISLNGSGGFRVTPMPFDPGGSVEWTPSIGGVQLRSGSLCGYTASGYDLTFNCGGSGNCGCGGCSVAGTYSLEQSSFETPSVWCGCWYDDPEHSGEPGNPQTNTPSVTVSFDQSALFFEDTYTDATNNIVGRRSNRAVLTVAASAGGAGGALQVTAQNINKLCRTGGHAISLPYKAFLPPNGGASFTIEYEALKRSDAVDDIVVTASFTANQGMSPPSQSDCLTAVQVEILADTNNLPSVSKNRHMFGVGETVQCDINPAGVAVSLFSSMDITWQSGDQKTWTASMPYIDADSPMPLQISSEGEDFLVVLQCLVPHDLVAISAEPGYCGGQTNKAGYASLCCLLELHPKTVSFAGHVILREVPATGIPADGTHEGYFAAPAHSNNWYHTPAHGAGKWWTVKENNVTEYDAASWKEECPPPWSDGYIVWNNPIAWRPASERELGDSADRVFCYKPGTFRIDGLGTMRVEKFNHEVHRAVTGDYWRDGVWIKWISEMEKYGE